MVTFVECVDLDNKSCLGNACDDIGQTRQFNVRKLVFTTTEMDVVIGRLRAICSDTNQFEGQFNLPDIAIPRPLFSSTGSVSNSYFDFMSNFVTSTYESNVFIRLITAITSTYTIFESILGKTYGGNNHLTTLP